MVALLALTNALAAPQGATPAKPADKPVAATAGATSAPAFALEPGLTVTVPVPTAGLSPGLGLRVLGDVAVLPRLGVGAELAVRLPGGAAGELGDDALAEDLEWSTGLTVLLGGARVAYAFGPLDGLHGRVALAGGVAYVSQATDTQVGRTHDAVLTGWVQPEVGGLYPVGPGQLTFDLLVPVAPADLLVLGPAPGGTGVAIVVGYRFVL